MKSRFSALSLLFCAATAVSAFAAEITFYERDGFGGRSFSANQSISDFANVGFNDSASSVVVKSGTWQLCSDAFFRGRCVTISRGEYPTLRSMQLQNQISSAREMEWLGNAAGAPPGGARAELFDGLQFGGRAFPVNAAINNFSDVGFNDRALSMIVTDGAWEICEHADFRGACQTYGPGRYPDLGDLGWRVSSIRAVGGGPGRVGGGLGSVINTPGLAGGGAEGGGRVELFDVVQFNGRAFAVNAAIANFADVGFNDRAQSMVVRDGIWEACEHADFRGTCQTFGRGRYPNLGGLAGRISSIRPIGTDPDRGGWGSGSRAVLYEGPNLSGRSFVINTEVAANLANTGFNDRASSVRVEGGYWIFCSDANFAGECRTFGPGDYPTLPWELTYKISSGRRIHGNYPYSQNPNWPR